MSLNTPIRYINDGEPLDEVVLNRYVQDSQQNLENLFSRVDGYDSGTTEAISDRVVLRDNDATSKFGVPTDDQHPWRLNEFREYMYEYFEESDRSNNDPMMILNYDHLPKATNSTPGITKLIDSYTSSDGSNAPTAEALGDFYRWLIDNNLVALDRLPKATTSSQGIVQLDSSCGSTSTTKAPTAAALNSCLQEIRDQLTSVENSIPSEDDIGGPTVFSWDELQNGAGIEIGALEKDQAASANAIREMYEALFLDGGRLSYKDLPPGYDPRVESFIVGQMYKVFPNHTPADPTDLPGAERFPFIIVAGAGVTGPGGKIFIEYPITFRGRRISYLVNEGHATGWKRSGDLAEPTIYGAAIEANGDDQKVGVTIYGARVMNDGTSRFQAGLYCNWIFFGY